MTDATNLEGSDVDSSLSANEIHEKYGDTIWENPPLAALYCKKRAQAWHDLSESRPFSRTDLTVQDSALFLAKGRSDEGDGEYEKIEPLIRQLFGEEEEAGSTSSVAKTEDSTKPLLQKPLPEQSVERPPAFSQLPIETSHSSPTLEQEIKKNPRYERQIRELVELYCDPRLHDCTYENGCLFYRDPSTEEQRELAMISGRVAGVGTGRGGGSRVVYEGPTEGTVVKLVPDSSTSSIFDAQTQRELATYVDSNDEDRQRLVRFHGFKKIGNIHVVLEEKIETLPGDGTDFKNALRSENSAYPASNEKLHEQFLADSFDDLRRIQNLMEWGWKLTLVDSNPSNMGKTRNGRYVFHDFGGRRDEPEFMFLLRLKEYAIDFEAIKQELENS